MPSCTCRPYHVIGCPAYGEDNRIDGRLVTPVAFAASLRSCPTCGSDSIPVDPEGHDQTGDPLEAR